MEDSEKASRNGASKTTHEDAAEERTEDLTSMPGSSGEMLVQMVQLLTRGHLFFEKKIEKYKSTVFKCNFFGTPFIAVSDYKGIQCLMDSDKVDKEAGFGNFRLNTDLLDGHIPSMFTNGNLHKKLKGFIMEVVKTEMRMQKLIPNIMDIMPEHLIKWNFKKGMGCLSQEEWEERILHLSMDILSETLLDIRLSGSSFLAWRSEVLKKPKTDCFGKPFGAYKRALNAFDHLKDAIANSPRIDATYLIADKHGLTEEEAVLQVLWMLNFNAAPGTGAAMRSAAARLSIMKEEERVILKQEMKDCLGTIGLNLKTLHQMKKLDRLVNEVLRLHPPVALFFGVAKKNFILESCSGKFEVKQGQKLVGNCHLVQRDPALWNTPGCGGPEDFDPSRFEKRKLKKQLIVEHGAMADVPTPDNHKCAGSNVAKVVLKSFILYLVLFCDWDLEEKPFWTNKSLIRYGNPDEPIRLKYFRYRRDKEALLLPDQPSSSSSSEDSDNDEATLRDSMVGWPEGKPPFGHEEEAEG